ncbi:MAG TPA: hypothetical protein VKQ32_01235 [Polyangia bacterium]|nr:hypothetical protein [Polyangia bacterium]
MRARLAIIAATFSGLVIATPSPAQAAHHLWRFSQLFSNASGSVQYIQLAVGEDNENAVSGFTITSGTNTFTFPGNLPNSLTATHKWILIGTANLATLTGGVTPDFTIPANFFPTGGGTLTYASGTDTWAYGAVPVDGRNALFKSGATVTTGLNNPINFNLDSGSLSLATSVPAASGPWIAALVGGLLLAASGLLRARKSPRRSS